MQECVLLSQTYVELIGRSRKLTLEPSGEPTTLGWLMGWSAQNLTNEVNSAEKETSQWNYTLLVNIQSDVVHSVS